MFVVTLEPWMILFAFVANMWVFALRFSAVYPPVVSVAWLPWLLLVICWFDIGAIQKGRHRGREGGRYPNLVTKSDKGGREVA